MKIVVLRKQSERRKLVAEDTCSVPAHRDRPAMAMISHADTGEPLPACGACTDFAEQEGYQVSRS